MPRRVVVKGTSGSGKTAFAAELASRLDVPHVELDALNHGPGWAEASADELRARVEKALAGLPSWVVDGNYDTKLGPLLLDQADLIVWLDLPLRVKLRRLWRRTCGRIRRREELWHGNHETWRNAFWGRDSLFAWTIRTHFRHRREWPAFLASRQVERLRTSHEVEGFLARRAGERR